MKQDNIELEGVVIQELVISLFKVEVLQDQEIICTISGKIRKNFIKIITGDKVKLEVSPYDLTRGRITKRMSQISSSQQDNNKKKVLNKNKSNKQKVKKDDSNK